MGLPCIGTATEQSRYTIEINISGGEINATNTDFNNTPTHYKPAAIGSFYYNGKSASGTIRITGGEITASVVAPRHAIGSGYNFSPGNINVYVDGVLTDTTGTNDGSGNNVYHYSRSSQTPNGTDEATPGRWLQTGANASQGTTIQFVNATTRGIGLTGIDVLSHESATNAIAMADKAIGKVSEYRSYFGAMQNALENTIAVNGITAENTQTAESKIRDTDMASNISEFFRHNILLRMSQALLAQGNAAPERVLMLLK